mgnify:CR=1 FL=1
MTTTSHNIRSTPFELQVRKDTRFDFSSVDTSIHTEGNLYTSHFFNALSLVAPLTEGMLIRAIRKAQPMLEGSEFANDAKAFIGQEAIHTREHRAFNKRLEELGLDAKATLEEMEQGIKEIEATKTLQEHLAIVVTGEHIIYAFTRALLASSHRHFEQHDTVRALFIWHSLEEMEHQSVCDDIYKHLYGTGTEHRVLYYRSLTSTGNLLGRIVVKLIRSLLAQSREPKKGELREFISWLVRTPGMGTIATKEILSFFSPRFNHWSRLEEDQKLISTHLKHI